MREILFRGKRKDNGAWVEGYLYEHQPPLPGVVPKDYVPEPSRWFIVRTAFADWNMPRQVEFIEVDPATIGQYTGLMDKHGKRIFEGDIFQYGFCEVAAIAVVKFGEFGFGSQFDMNQVGFYAEWNPRAMYYRTDLGFWAKQREIEVIGNVHDNPELIGGGDG